MQPVVLHELAFHILPKIEVIFLEEYLACFFVDISIGPEDRRKTERLSSPPGRMLNQLAFSCYFSEHLERCVYDMTARFRNEKIGVYEIPNLPREVEELVLHRPHC